jgi:RNase P subunit RPR2
MTEETPGKWDKMIAEQFGEPYTPPPTHKVKRPECPHCAALLYRLEWQLRIDGKQRRYQSFWGCYRCMAVYRMDLSPALPVPEQQWADDYCLNLDGELTKAQLRRENRLLKRVNKAIDEHNKEVKARDNDQRTKLLHLYQTGTPHCEDCGETDIRTLQRHHQDGNPRNNRRDNIRILCANCHWKQTMPKKSKRYQDPKQLTPSLIYG